jgi:PAS domain S-box-containing protein
MATGPCVMTEDKDALRPPDESQPPAKDEIRRLNAEIQAERNFIATVLDAADCIVVVLDAAQRIVLANGAVQRILGYAPADVTGQLLNALFPSAPPLENMQQGENDWPTKDGGWRFIAWTATTLAPGLTILTGHDVTERQRAEERRALLIRLESSQHEANASAAKDEFLATLSHEFRTPLNAILGYTHMLLNGVTGLISDPQRKSLSRIDSNSQHLLALINDILDITRIEAGRMPLNLSTFKIPALVEEVMSELEAIIRRSNLSVRAVMPRSLPSLRSDRQKVKQIVLNLLSNALKFTPAGSVTIRASYEARARALNISVSDTGVGIADADRVKVFEDFRQLDSSPARGYGGTGLGLSICRRLSQMLDGTIELDSKVGKGSTFTLSLPARLRKR